jgi:hypothetical protein
LEAAATEGKGKGMMAKGGKADGEGRTTAVAEDHGFILSPSSKVKKAEATPGVWSAVAIGIIASLCSLIFF